MAIYIRHTYIIYIIDIFNVYILLKKRINTMFNII